MSSFSKTGAQIRHTDKQFQKVLNVQQHFSRTRRQGGERESLHLCRNQRGEKPSCSSLDATGSKGPQAVVHCPQWAISNALFQLRGINVLTSDY